MNVTPIIVIDVNSHEYINIVFLKFLHGENALLVPVTGSSFKSTAMSTSTVTVTVTWHVDVDVDVVDDDDDDDVDDVEESHACHDHEL